MGSMWEAMTVHQAAIEGDMAQIEGGGWGLFPESSPAGPAGKNASIAAVAGISIARLFCFCFQTPTLIFLRPGNLPTLRGSRNAQSRWL
jgi:hypothetical protein